MTVGVWNRQWLNANSQRAYPLTEAATATDTSGAFTLPTNIILGLRFPIHVGLNVQPGMFYLSQLIVTSTSLTIAIAYDDGSSDPPTVGSVAVALDTHKEYDQYALPGKGDFADSVGQLILGRPADIEALPAGDFRFTYGGGQLEVDTIVPMIRDVQSLSVINGSDQSVRMYGDIELVAGSNLRLTPILMAGQDPKIRIDAIDGEGLNEDCVCVDQVSPCIRTINGISPDKNGNFVLQGDTCVVVKTASGGLVLSNSCSAPCCGCEELEALKREMDVFGDAYATVRGFVDRLQVEVTTMSQVVLGSRLNDDGCFTCNIET